MKKLITVLVLAALPMAAGAQAKKKESMHDKVSGQGYGMAGCGLGSIVFGQKPGMIQIVAATLNGTGGNQTFGVTFGTSNCSEPGVFAKANDFIETNKVALEKDIVRGEGESLASLSQVLECSNQSFAPEMKRNYVSTFPAGGASSEQLNAIAIKSCWN